MDRSSIQRREFKETALWVIGGPLRRVLAELSELDDPLSTEESDRLAELEARLEQLNQEQVELVREIRDRWDDWQDDAPFDSWQDAVRDKFGVDPEAAVEGRLVHLEDWEPSR